jgi:hypothetical protein
VELLRLGRQATIKTEDGERPRKARKHPEQKDFLQKIARLWFAIRK